MYYREKYLHADSQAMVIKVNFWPICGRNAVRRHLQKRITCFRVKPVPVEHQMSNLPFNCAQM